MNVSIPWGLILVFISLSTFYYFNQKRKIKRNERRKRLLEIRQKFLNSILETNNIEPFENKVTK